MRIMIDTNILVSIAVFNSSRLSGMLDDIFLITLLKIFLDKLLLTAYTLLNVNLEDSYMTDCRLNLNSLLNNEEFSASFFGFFFFTQPVVTGNALKL